MFILESAKKSWKGIEKTWIVVCYWFFIPNTIWLLSLLDYYIFNYNIYNKIIGTIIPEKFFLALLLIVFHFYIPFSLVLLSNINNKHPLMKFVISLLWIVYVFSLIGLLIIYYIGWELIHNSMNGPMPGSEIYD